MPTLPSMRLKRCFGPFNLPGTHGWRRRQHDLRAGEIEAGAHSARSAARLQRAGLFAADTERAALRQLVADLLQPA